MHLETLKGQPASILGLAGHQAMDASCVALAFEAGVNYFFFYDLSHESLLRELKPIVATHRDQVLIATGSEDRNLDSLRQYLMHRYNMAHRKAEEQVFPMAQQAGIPIVAFTCTRWGELLRGHPDWQGEIPTAADCYRYALHQKAVDLALTAPQTREQLEENLSVLHAPELAPEAVERWQEYGALVYGNGQDAFETKWL